MAELKNCEKCGRMFSAENGHEYCSKCRLDVEDHFKIVREYIYDNPGSTVKEVEEGTGVSRKEILEYLRQEKLELKNESSEISCQRCGKPIKSGRMCPACARELKEGLTKGFKKNPKEEKKKSTGWYTKKR